MHASTKLLFGAALGLALVTQARGGGAVELAFQLDHFTNPLLIDNPYSPLLAGLRTVYAETNGEECAVNEVVVTSDTKQDFQNAYAGLAARPVLDRVWRDNDCDGGRDLLLEDTVDWYGQDDFGNLWYFGEDTTEYLYDDSDQLLGTSKEGSWEAGQDGAVAGVVMLANPESGAFYQQEFSADVAEDMAKVTGVDRPVSIGLGDFEHCIITKETSPLEPGVVEHKYYCPNVGLVLVAEFRGKTTLAELVEIAPP